MADKDGILERIMKEKSKSDIRTVNITKLEPQTSTRGAGHPRVYVEPNAIWKV